jgi:hypothetical protein
MPEISDEDLKKLKDEAAEAAKLKGSVAALEGKNKELLEEKKTEAQKRVDAEKLAKEAEEKRLKDAGDYKTLSEQLAAEKADREKSDKENKEKLAKGAKLSKVQEELGKQGLDPKAVAHALKLVDLEQVKYDESTGVVIGADAVASKLKVELPNLFVKADKEKMNNGDGGDIPAEQMTVEWFSKLSAADQDKHHAAFMKAQGY